MNGERDKAAKLLADMPTIVAKKHSSVDPIVLKQAARYLSNGGWFAGLELLYIRRDMAKMEKSVAEVLQLLERQAANTNALKPIAATPEKKGLAGLTKGFGSFGIGNSKKKDEPVDHSADDRAAYHLIKGALLRSAEKSDEAIECFREVIRLDPLLKEKWYVPYALFELGESLYHKGNISEAQEAMKKCNNIGGYDWEDPLKVRLRVTIDQLKKGGLVDDSIDEEVAGAGPATPELVQPQHEVAAN